VAEWIVETEEGGKFSQDGFVGEERRFHDVTFDFDLKTRVGRVWARRRTVDGVWENVTELLDMSNNSEPSPPAMEYSIRNSPIRPA